MAAERIPYEVLQHELRHLLGGVVAGRERPNGAPFAGFPSGHTLGTLVQFGLAIYLTLRMTGRRRLLVPVVAVLALPVVLVGPARVSSGPTFSVSRP